MGKLADVSTAENPVRENTLILYLTDNGYRTPLLANYPAVLHNPRRYPGKMVQSVELFPTSMDYAGVAMPADPKLEGRSLRPLLEADPNLPDATIPWRLYVFGHQCRSIKRTNGTTRYLRTENGIKYIVKPNGVVRIYDVSKDPGERHNLDPVQFSNQTPVWRQALDDW